MAQQVTEKISHFIGYLHIAELLNLVPLRYSGAPTYEPMHLGDDAPSVPWSLSTSLPAAKPGPRPTELSSEPTKIVKIAKIAPQPPLPPVELAALELPPPRLFLPSPENPQLPLFAPMEPVRLIAQLPDIRVEYTYGGNAGQWIDIFQRNALSDNDVVLIDLKALVGNRPVPPEVLETLQDMADLALAEIPAGPLVPFALPNGIESLQGPIGTGIEIDLADASGAHSAHHVDGNGRWVAGEKVSAAGQSPAEQMSDLRTMLEAAQGEAAFGDPRSAAHRAPDSLDEDGGFRPASGLELHAGGNTQANIAVITDVGGAAFGSRIILGDYHETNLIAQINVLRDVDRIWQHDTETALRIATGSNLLRNEASFIDELGRVPDLDPTVGFSGATHWRVDYAQGHFIDISSFVQHNLMFDIDQGEAQQTQAYQLVTFGENDQINITNLLELGARYDLVIIGGDYYKLNAILQFNIVLDDDIAEQLTHFGKTPGTTGGNLLSNDAAIIGTGGKTFNPLNDNVIALTDAIAAGDTTLDPRITFGLPDNGDGVLDVLYVAGDYFNFNLIVQTNILADLDTLRRSGDADEDEDEVADESVVIDDDFAQMLTAGGNTALNGAMIFDLDSQSHYQFLGGEAYETSILIQADILVEEEDDTDAWGDLEDPLDGDAVAVVAALSGDGDDLPEDFPIFAGLGHAGVDVMGGVLG